MINIINPNNIVLNPKLSALLTDFKRKQVSRFPINAEIENEYLIRFFDSRISYAQSTKIENIIGELKLDGLDDKNRQYIRIDSRLINNEKYSDYNINYYSRQTVDDKKVSKWMRDYLKPFSIDEIIDKTVYMAESKVEFWIDQPKNLVHDLVSSSKSDIMQELYAMKQAGLEPVTNTFKKYMGDAMNAYEDWLERKKKKFSRTHVFINPDESVVITIKDDESKSNTTTYESLAECPSIIQQNVTLLRMLEGDNFIPQVGMRSSKVEFWIETHTDSE